MFLVRRLGRNVILRQRNIAMAGRYLSKNNVLPYGVRYNSNWKLDKIIPTVKREAKDRDEKSNISLKFITERDRILAQTSGFFAKLRINLRWLLKRSLHRPFNTDDIGAFISWILVSNFILFMVWTTSFVSVIIYLLNTVYAQEYVAEKVGNFLTKNSDLSVVFESAVVPDWSSGRITFKNVFISRRPEKSHNFTKGSQTEAAQRAKLALSESLLVNREDFDNGNYTQFDLTIDQVEISLNFRKWLNGRGIINEMLIQGLRGIVDRTHVFWKANDDPRNYKNIAQPGDFEISNFKMSDVLFTLYQPDGFRPFEVSIFNCDLPQLRKHWLFYDILNANSMNGAYDNSMFTIHRKYKIPGSNININDDDEDDGDSPISPWRKVTRFRVDNLDIDHLNAGIEGPFGWITEGKVNMIGDVLLPNKNALQITEILAEISNRVLKEAKRYNIIPSSKTPASIPLDIEPDDYFIMDFFLRLNHVKATVPLFAPGLTYMNNALIRPIVGYINSHRTFIPIRCRVVKKMEDFEGSWTVYDSYLMQDLSAEVYDAFADYVADDQRRSLRIKKVGFWSLQIIVQLILMSLGSIA
uniref:Mitochondrial inner membrane protein n=1 Tax=Nakaseomyces delphensis TaxID=51657 RepID=A7WPF8_NAKDE|nr:mitochondrial inner membrane protein [Nakaseomyces delphensis]